MTERQIILVVEDELLILLNTVSMLEDAGYKTLEAENADAAIRILESRGDVKLVFTDVDMPGTMDGLKLVAYIRKRWPPIRLVVASGKAIIAENQLPAGARFFSKPYADNTIIDTIRALLLETV